MAHFKAQLGGMKLRKQFGEGIERSALSIDHEHAVRHLALHHVEGRIELLSSLPNTLWHGRAAPPLGVCHGRGI